MRKKIRNLKYIAVFLLFGAVVFFGDCASVCGNRIDDVIPVSTGFLSPRLNLSSPFIFEAFKTKAGIPEEDIELLADILGCSKKVMQEISDNIVLYLSNKKDLYQLEITISRLTTSRRQLVSPYVCIPNDGSSLSIATSGKNHFVMRFSLEGGRLFFSELGLQNRGNIKYEDQDTLMAVTEHIRKQAFYLIRPEGIMLEDLNRLFWAVPKENFFRSKKGSARPVSKDEIYFILSEVNNMLSENKFQPEKEDSELTFMQEFSLMDDSSGIGSRNMVDKRVSEHSNFFQALNPAPDEFLVFLARDAVSAHEFFEYLEGLSGFVAKRSGLVCQPGLPQHLRISSFKQDRRLAHVQDIITEVFNETKDDLGMERMGLLKEKEDESIFEPQRYRLFASKFKEKMIKAIETDPIVREEAEFVYRQIKNTGALAYKKIRIADLNASGKTILYVKSVLEYFAEKDGIKNTVNEFVGNGRGQAIGMPKVRHAIPQEQVKFADIMWPFFIVDRDYATGAVSFDVIKSRNLVLMHTYQSLKIMNEAINYFNSQFGGGGSLQQLASDGEQEKRGGGNMFRPENILEMSKDEFIAAYQKNGYFRPGFFGEKRNAISKRLDEWFGRNNWHIYYLIDGQFVSLEKILSLFENAYVEYFKAYPQELDWLANEARDVYDNAESNVTSGTDYTKQETPDYHFQDIAIRRAFLRLGKKFDGERLIQIRGPRSEGYRLNPGYVPFHRPELILQPVLAGWWKPNSVEAFYQSAKVIVLESSLGIPDRNVAAENNGIVIEEAI